MTTPPITTTTKPVVATATSVSITQGPGAGVQNSGPPKPKAPRRESTRIAAANKIASTHPDPKTLLGLLDDDAEQKIEAESAEIETAEKALAVRRANHKAQRTFVEETTGLDQMSMVGIKAILVARSK